MQLSEEEKALVKQAEPYSSEIDFSWFAVHIGYTRKDYDELTPLERALIRKQYDDKTEVEERLRYNTVAKGVHNSVVTALSKKARVQRLFKTDGARKLTQAEKEKVEVILKKEKERNQKPNGMAWRDKILQGNRILPKAPSK